MQIKTHAFFLAVLAGAVIQGSAHAGDKDVAQLRRGAQLLAYGGCVDCHTPFKLGPKGPEKDMARGLSGHPAEPVLPPPPRLDGPWNWVGSASATAFHGPWGTSYASNLTPDRETGIGTWTEKDFIRTLRSGKHLGSGRPIMPPMPWQAVGSLSDADLRALFAYLKAQPPVKNKVPDYQPPAAATSQAQGAGKAG